MIKFRVNDYLYSIVDYKNGIRVLVRGEIDKAPEQCMIITSLYAGHTSMLLAEAIWDSSVLGTPEERLLLEVFEGNRLGKAKAWIAQRQAEYNPK